MSEFDPVRVLVHLGAGDPPVGPLLRYLELTRRLRVEAGRDLRPDGHHVVVGVGEHTPKEAELEAIDRHLKAGGGLLLLGGAVAAWTRSGRFAELAGWAPGDPGPPTELRVQPVPGSPVSDRLDAELLMHDRLFLGDPPPADAAPLLKVPWHFGERVAAFIRPLGAGRCLFLSLGSLAATWEQPAFHRLVYRSLLAAADLRPGPPLGIGLYGFGAIGQEHARAVLEVEGLELRAICDRAPARRTEAAAFGTPTHAEAREMLADPAVDIVVVGLPPVLHETAVLECLAAGKHVVCEKPFALRVGEVDCMLAAAAGSGRVLTVYQSRRWDPDYVALRRAVEAGAIGHPFYAEAFIGGYGHPCSYWHSHEPVSGGTIFDWGSHYFDWLLQLMPGSVARVSASAHKRVWHDVTNADQVRVDLTFAGGEQATFLQSDVAAAIKPKWYVLGTAGAALGEWRHETVKTRAWTGDLVEEALQPSESPAVVSLHRPDGQGGVHREVLALPPREPNGFYRNLADHLLLGEPLSVRPEEARRNVAVMEAAARSIAAGGRQIDLDV